MKYHHMIFSALACVLVAGCQHNSIDRPYIDTSANIGVSDQTSAQALKNPSTLTPDAGPVRQTAPQLTQTQKSTPERETSMGEISWVEQHVARRAGQSQAGRQSSPRRAYALLPEPAGQHELLDPAQFRKTSGDRN